MEIYGQSLEYQRYLEVEKRAQEVLPDLDKLINKLKKEAILFQEATLLGNSPYCISTSAH